MIPVAQRFWRQVDVSDAHGCWPWTAAVAPSGYGRFGVSRAEGGMWAHRMAYLLSHGPIPDGQEIDHLCRNRRCVNPAHLEAVTHAENMRRSFAARPTCGRGHTYTGERTHGNRRRCRTCERIRDARRAPRRKVAA